MAVRTEEQATTPVQPKIVPSDSEYALSVIGLVMSIAGQPIVGLILSIIGLRQSRQAGRYNSYALLGMIFGIVFTAIAGLIVLGYAIVSIGSQLLYRLPY